MAGGEGTRLRPLTMNEPKPMLPMANKPMAEHIVSLLRRHGIDEIVVTVAFLANTIRTYFGDGSEFGVHLIYATEQNLLGTAGSVLNAREVLDERFLVISGDILTDIDLSALIAYHEEKGAMATLALKAMANPLEFGIVITDDEGRIERFLEKPGWGQVFSDTINTGIYVLEPEVLEKIPSDRPADFSEHVFPALLEEGSPLYAFVTDRYWEDVGNLDAFLRAHKDILDNKVDVAIDAFPLRQGVYIGSGAEVEPSATVETPVLIGDNCRIGPGARIGAYTVLGKNVRVGANSSLERSIVFDNCYLGRGVVTRGAVIGRSSQVREGAHLDEGVVIAGSCQVGRHAVISSGVKIYPNKVVEAGATVTSSIIWESRGSRSLFSRLGVAGLANVDLSPELAVRVAAAYATLLPKGSTVTTSRDSSRAARMLKRAAMVGLTSAGLNVEDLEAATLPVTRLHIRTGQSQGGMTVRLARGDTESVVIRFLDADGMDLDDGEERRIERLFYREDARRVLAGEIGDIRFPPRTSELYTAAVSASVDIEPIRRAHFKLVIDYAFGTASFLMPNVLARLDAEVLAINPSASTAGVLDFNREVHATRLAELVRSSGAHLGVVISPDAEHLTIVDDTGKILSDGEALLAMTLLVADVHPGARIAIPVSTTWRVNEICTERGSEVVWSKLGHANLMGVATSTDAYFAGDSDGGFAFPEFLPAFDAVASFVHLLGLLTAANQHLSDIVSVLPHVCVVHEEISTRFEQKGSLMRGIADRARGDELVLIDGVKSIDAEGWTLVVPDQDEPITHVFAEADTMALSSERAARAVEEVHAVLRET